MRRLIYYIGICVFLFTKCGTPRIQENSDCTPRAMTTELSYGNYEAVVLPAYNEDRRNSEIIMHERRDSASNMVMYRTPLPASWKLTNTGAVGPQGLHIENLPAQKINLSSREISCVDQLIKEDIIPKLTQKGMKVTEIYPMPEVAQKNKEIFSMFWTAVPTIYSHDARGIEFAGNRDQKGMLVVQFNLSKTKDEQFIYYQITRLTANEAYFNQAKNDMLFGFKHIRVNPLFIAMINYRVQQVAQREFRSSNPYHNRPGEMHDFTKEDMERKKDNKYKIDYYKPISESSDNSVNKQVEASKSEKDLLQKHFDRRIDNTCRYYPPEYQKPSHRYQVNKMTGYKRRRPELHICKPDTTIKPTDYTGISNQSDISIPEGCFGTEREVYAEQLPWHSSPVHDYIERERNIK